MFLGAIRDSALPDPRDEILIHHVRIDPVSHLFVLERTVPIRDALLHERLAIDRDAVIDPHVLKV